MAARSGVSRAIRVIIVTPFVLAIIALIVHGLMLLLIKIAPVALVSSVDFEFVALIIIAIISPFVVIKLYKSSGHAATSVASGESARPNVSHGREHQVENVFQTSAGTVALLPDGRIIAFAQGYHEFYPSAQEYRRSTKDHEAWEEISDPVQRSAVIADVCAAIGVEIAARKRGN